MIELKHFHPEAKRDFLALLQYQNEHYPELAGRWLFAFERVLNSIRGNPYQYCEREAGGRCAPLGRFPHYIGYIVRGEEVDIIAVGSTSQSPTYWVNRLK